MGMTSPNISVAEILAAARRPEVVEAMRAFYAEVDRLVAAQSPVCLNKGECCRFAQFGHRLYVTALEVSYYLARMDEQTVPAVTEEVCPHAFDGNCHARDRRPLGCRVFYCDPAAGHWQGPLTEEMLGRLRKMHDEFAIPYFYAEWLTVLRELVRESLPAPSSPGIHSRENARE